MNEYKPRTIQFKERIKIDGWSVKVYTIVKEGTFQYPEFYAKVLEHVPEWLSLKNGFDDSNDKIAFLILHAGTEGIFSLINTWVGTNMLNTNIFISKRDNLTQFEKISGNGLSPCIWELEIINHERVSWTNHVLKKYPNPSIDIYLDDVINIEL